MQQQRPIFLLTDFGVSDPFVGIMKSVMLRLGCDGQMIDLSHGIGPQDVLGGAIAIEDSWPWLPSDAILLAVVDPGVGTNRRALALSLDQRLAVGPDNGLFEPLLANGACARLIQPGGVIQPDRSSTFHGRDVFAPAAALLATGRREFFQMGPEVGEPKRLAIPRAVMAGEGGELLLRVLTVDHFGNAVLNLRVDQAPANDVERLTFWHGDQMLGPLRRTFGDVPRGGGAGLLELCRPTRSCRQRWRCQQRVKPPCRFDRHWLPNGLTSPMPPRTVADSRHPVGRTHHQDDRLHFDPVPGAPRDQGPAHVLLRTRHSRQSR